MILSFLLVKVRLNEQFSGKVRNRRPGDQDGGEEGEDTKQSNHENHIVSLYDIYEAILSFHDDHLSPST